MKSLLFNRLLVLSNTTKSANQFEFSKTLNLITANDNSVGKSTLLKLLLWGLGCEPELDTTWKSLDCTTIVEFSIGSDLYKVRRYKGLISLKINSNPYIHYPKITGDYAAKFADIVNFKALLPNQSSGNPEVPPPAYYFIPFYIDQKRSWAKTWDNFENLGQYQNWKSTIVRYHIGLLSPKHFDIEFEKSVKKEEQKFKETEVFKFTAALEVVESYIPQRLQTVTSIDAISKLTDGIKSDLTRMQTDQEKLLNDLALLNSELAYLKQQKVLTQELIVQLDADYKYTVENIIDDEIECPLCGSIHENSIVNRASILTDKAQAESQLEEIDERLFKMQTSISNTEIRLNVVRGEIENINTKYVIEDGNREPINFNRIIENVAGKSIRDNVVQSKNDKLSEIKLVEEELKELKSKQKELTTKEHIQEINTAFETTFTKYVGLLDAESVNLSGINSPLDYNKIVKEGGAAESARAILAYYLTIFKLVEQFGDEVKSPLIIDTPNQQEQSHTNYDKIVDILVSQFAKGNQIFMGAMANEHLKPYMTNAHIINLKEDKLLRKSEFEKLKSQFN